MKTVELLIAQNIEAMNILHAREQQEISGHQRLIEVVSEGIGSPRSVFGLMGAAALWVTYNLIAPTLHLFVFERPPFYWMQGAFTVYAGCVTTIVLAAQNRQRVATERRAHFELQVNLLAEQRTAKIIALLEELRRDLPNVKNRVDHTAAALQVPVHPHLVAHVADSPRTPSDDADDAADPED